MIQLEKSNNDKRDYEYIKMENGLECVIIKDLNANMCGACLNVYIGSVNEKVDGLAHFLEHMVFMGSKKYPDSNDFMSSINKNGGKTNAYTSDTDTNYHFTIDPENFPVALDKFSQFFKDPLLKHEYIDKEINAVDSEAKKNLLDDVWIQLELYKTLLEDSHPIKHFTCGDLDSLKIDNIEQELRTFHSNYYDAKNMTLAILINDDINYDGIKKIVMENFGEIKTYGIDKKVNRKYGKIIQDNSIVYYVPQKDEIFLTILIEVPTILKSLENPYSFISYIIGSELDNSLYSYLLHKGYVTRSSVSELLNFDDYSIITIEYTLTEDGEKNFEDLYNINIKYFEYVINKLKDKDKDLEKLYLELLQNNKNTFNYWESDDIVETIIPMTNVMKEDLPREYLLSSDIHLIDYDILCEIVKNNINSYSFAVSYGSKNNQKICKTKFPRYDVCYMLDKIKLKDVDLTKFTLPILNKFICYNLNVITQIEPMKIPIQLKNDPYNSFYYGDKSYNLPIVDIRATIKIPNILNNPESYVGMLLYLNSAYGDINELKEMAKLAGYSLYLKLDYDTLYILISGYTENIYMVIELLHNIFNHEFKQRSFNTAHYELVKSLKNAVSENPVIQSHIIFEKEIFEKYFTPAEQYRVAKKMSIDRCREVFKQVYTDCRINILTVGNVTIEKCSEINDLFFSYINIIKNAEIILDDNMNRIRKITERIIKTPNKDEKNSIASVIYDVDRFRKNETEHWKSQILFYRIYNTLVSNKFFYELRTKRQMGYIVKAKILLIDSNNHTNVFLEFIVQSPKYTVKEIINEINKFIENENIYILKKMSLKEFEEAVNAEKTKLKQKFNNLSDLGSYFMSGIIDESFDFRFKEQLLSKIDRFSFDKFKKYLTTYIVNNPRIYNIGVEKN